MSDYSNRNYGPLVEDKPNQDTSMSDDDKKLHTECLAMIEAFKSANPKVKDRAKRVREFMKGHHYALDDLDKEQAGVAEGELPVVNHAFYTADTIVGAIGQEPARPYVTAEDATNFPSLPDDHPFIQMKRQYQEATGADPSQQMETDNEVVARLLNARLDFTWDKLELECLFDEALEYAAWQRHVFMLVGYDQSANVDGTVLDILEVEDVFYDPNAKRSIEDGRFAGYKFSRTVDYCKSKWGYEAPVESESFNSDRTEPSKGKGIPRGMQPVEVFCLYVKDTSTKRVKVEIEVEDEIPTAMGSAAVTSTQEIEVDAPKYPGGWKRVYFTRDKILDVGENKNGSGRLPIKHFVFYKEPNRPDGMSVFDLELDPNQAMNHSLRYALDNANKSQVKILVKKSGIRNLEEALENEAHGFIEVDTDYNLNEVFQIVPAAPLAQAQVEMLGLISNMQEHISGTIDLRDAAKAPRDISGRAVEGLMGQTEARFSRIRRRWERFVRDVSRDVIHNILKYEDREITVRLSRDWNVPAFVDINPSILSFDQDDFEAKWDITVSRPKNMPQNPIDRNEFVLAAVRRLSDMHPSIALASLDILELPEEAALRNTLRRLSALQEQQPPQDPVAIEQGLAQVRVQFEQQKLAMQLELEKAKTMADIEAERERATLRVRSKAAESIGDAMEKISQILADNGEIAASLDVLGLIPGAVNAAIAGVETMDNLAYQQALAKMRVGA